MTSSAGTGIPRASGCSDVRSLKSLLRIGDTYTTGDVFDSIQFRGVQLMSDDEMLPDSQRGFAPTIRGVAHSNAKVTVSQHGYVIYETFVSPGAFAISDLYPTSQSGDLEVKVTESNGAVRTFTQPYSAVPYMLREGRGKFSLSAGRYHSGGESVRSPEFLQGTLFYGLTAGFTLYGGTQLARDYQAWALGLGRGFGEFGSLGGDVTQAVTRTPSGKRYTGHSLRAQYQKNFVSSGTAFSLASYRYSSSGYYDFAEASALESAQGQVDNRRRREELSVSQSLGGLGSLAVSAWSQEYWHRQSRDETVHLGFYSAWKGISWGVGYYYTRTSGQQKNDRSWSFNINIPLGGPLSDSAVSYNTTSDSNGYTSQQMSLYGAVPTRPNLFYSVQQGYGNQGRGSNSSASLDYHGGFGNAQIGYRHDAASNQLTWEAPARWSRIRTASPLARRWVRASPSSGRRGPPAWRCKTATMCTPTGAAMPWCPPDRLPEKCHYPRYGVDGRRHRRRPAGADRDPRRRRGGDGQLPDPHWQPGAVYPAQCPGAATVWRQCAAGQGGGERQSAGRHGGRRRPGVSQRRAAGGNPGGELDRQQSVAELHAAFSSSG